MAIYPADRIPPRKQDRDKTDRRNHRSRPTNTIIMATRGHGQRTTRRAIRS
ncbi:hypothetical protein DPMN_052924 [Dreissena polymorpha]|uniref:Uncharacterized protein n=1 Tax=Dreissena polymorpha TaxID=45954 RepID=A0A9D4HQ92_DREPO|nr:hypothetical protein DPMN_052924 [Dreissena polymorpha]